MCHASHHFRTCRHVAVMAAALVLLGSCAKPSRPDKPHHTPNGFKNVYDYERTGFSDFLKWRWDRLWKKIPAPKSYDFPLAPNDPNFLRSNRKKNTLTWIGHATVLLQMQGKNILTDPHFSERTAPVQWTGPRRVVPPGVALKDLPPIDIVVISHDHYDSLDEQTVLKLHAREGGQATSFFVPLGLKKWFEKRGVRRVFELDWWDAHNEGDFKIIAVPIRHWSKRGLFDRNKTLWAGWVIASDSFRFFFAGDSGYTPHFKDIGRKLGPFDLSAIPIGAYEPRWFMRHHHITPEEALQVHRDVRSRKSVAIHWGTFILTDEPLDEPPQRLAEAKKKNGLAAEAFIVLRHGETIVLDHSS